jgi:hypothetical protein
VKVVGWQRATKAPEPTIELHDFEPAAQQQDVVTAG